MAPPRKGDVEADRGYSSILTLHALLLPAAQGYAVSGMSEPGLRCVSKLRREYPRSRPHCPHRALVKDHRPGWRGRQRQEE